MSLEETLRAGRIRFYFDSILLARKIARRQAAAVFLLEGALDYFSREITQPRVQSGESREAQRTSEREKREGEHKGEEGRGVGGEESVDIEDGKRGKGVSSERAMICES